MTDESGVCVVSIDPVFSETIAQTVEYRVFLQTEGEGSVWVTEKNPAFFIVNGTPNIKFAWEIKAVQRDYEFLRIENFGNGYDRNEEDNEDSIITQTEGTYLKEYREIIEQEVNSYA